MRRISVREARAGFRGLLEKVRSGEEVVVTRRGRAVARVLPPARTSAALPSLAKFRAELAAPKGRRPAGSSVARMREDERW